MLKNQFRRTSKREGEKLKRIEFVGGSGVGKTTLLKEIIKLKKSKDCWMTVEETRRNLAKTIKLKRKLHKLFQLYLKINPISIFQQSMINRILNSYMVDVLDSMYEYYSDIADSIFETLCKNDKTNSVMNMSTAAHCFNLLYRELMFFNYFKIDSLVVFDESIIHHSSAFSDEEKVKMLFKNHKKLGTSIIPIGIVYCHLDRVKYLERRKNRIREGKATFFDRNQKNEELQKSCYRELKATEDKIKVLKNYDIEILKLNMENPVTVNAKKVYDFINKLSISL